MGLPSYLVATLLGYYSVAMLASQGPTSLWFGWRDRDAYLSMIMNGCWLAAGIASTAGLLLAPHRIVFQIVMGGYSIICDICFIVEGLIMTKASCKTIAKPVGRRNMKEAHAAAAARAHRLDEKWAPKKKDKATLEALRSKTFEETFRLGTRARWDILLQVTPIVVLLATMTLVWWRVDYQTFVHGKISTEEGTVYTFDLAWGLGWLSITFNSLARVVDTFRTERKKQRVLEEGEDAKPDSSYLQAQSNFILFTCFVGDNILQIVAIIVVSREKSYLLFQLPWLVGSGVNVILDSIYIYSNGKIIREEGCLPGACFRRLPRPAPGKLAQIHSRYDYLRTAYTEDLLATYPQRLLNWKMKKPHLTDPEFHRTLRRDHQEYGMSPAQRYKKALESWKQEEPFESDPRMEHYGESKFVPKPQDGAKPRGGLPHISRKDKVFRVIYPPDALIQLQRDPAVVAHYQATVREELKAREEAEKTHPWFTKLVTDKVQAVIKKEEKRKRKNRVPETDSQDGSVSSGEDSDTPLLSDDERAMAIINARHQKRIQQEVKKFKQLATKDFDKRVRNPDITYGIRGSVKIPIVGGFKDIPYVTGSDQPKNELIGEHHEDDDWHNPPPDLPVPIHGLRNQIIHGAHSTARNLIPTGRRAYSKSRNLIPAGRRFKASARPTAEPSEEVPLSDSLVDSDEGPSDVDAGPSIPSRSPSRSSLLVNHSAKVRFGSEKSAGSNPISRRDSSSSSPEMLVTHSSSIAGTSSPSSAGLNKTRGRSIIPDYSSLTTESPSRSPNPQPGQRGKEGQSSMPRGRRQSSAGFHSATDSPSISPPRQSRGKERRRSTTQSSNDTDEEHRK